MIVPLLVSSVEVPHDGDDHGLRMPNEAFLHQNLKLVGFGRQFGQINFGPFKVFAADLSAPILVL